jgi:hypothetical protein
MSYSYFSASYAPERRHRRHVGIMPCWHHKQVSLPLARGPHGVSNNQNSSARVIKSVPQRVVSGYQLKEINVLSKLMWGDAEPGGVQK